MPLEVDDLYKLIGIKETQLLAFQREYQALEGELQKTREELEKLKSEKERRDGKVSALPRKETDS